MAASTFQLGTVVLVTNVDGTTVPASRFFARGTVVKTAWVDLNGNPVTPSSAVTSVNGQTGAVTGAQAVANANINPASTGATTPGVGYFTNLFSNGSIQNGGDYLGGNYAVGYSASSGSKSLLLWNGSTVQFCAAQGAANVTLTATAGTLALDGNLSVSGGLSTGLVTKTANYPATAVDHKILMDSTTAAHTITLPTAVGIPGKEFIVKDWKGTAATNNITIACSGTEKIDGVATKVIASAYFSISIVSDGANWSMF